MQKYNSFLRAREQGTLPESFFSSSYRDKTEEDHHFTKIFLNIWMMYCNTKIVF